MTLQVWIAELYNGDQLVSSRTFAWKSGTWIALRLELSQQGDSWRLRGKAWDTSGPEPETWQLSHTPQKDPFAGRCSIWGIPYSGQPIQFEDLSVQRTTTGS